MDCRETLSVSESGNSDKVVTVINLPVVHLVGQFQFGSCEKIPYFSDHKTRRTIRRTMIFLFDFLEKNNDECILILVIYWKKTGLVHTRIGNHNLIYSS